MVVYLLLIAAFRVRLAHPLCLVGLSWHPLGIRSFYLPTTLVDLYDLPGRLLVIRGVTAGSLSFKSTSYMY